MKPHPRDERPPTQAVAAQHTVVTFGSRMFEHRVPVAKCALGGIQREALAGV